MMPAAKHFDPLLGIDIHIIQPPGPVPPVPIPHPFIGMVFDPMDYVPILGATVLVGGLPRAQAGSSGVALPPHIPMGGIFIKPPANEAEVFMGSATVAVDGDAFSHIGLPALSCQDIGIPPIPRLKKKKVVKSLVLPTTMVLSIPLPVLVGGPPTISLMALGMKVAMGLAMKLLGGLISKLKRWRNLRKARKGQNGARCNAGHPVDIITGAQFDSFLDARGPGDALFCWKRYYTTAHARHGGPLGFGFRHEYQHRLRFMPQQWCYEDARGREIFFPPLLMDGQEAREQGFILRRLDARRYELRHREQPRLLFEIAGEDHEMRLRSVRKGSRSVELYYTRNRLTQLCERNDDGEETRYALVYDALGHITEVCQTTPSRRRLLAAYAYEHRGCLVVAQNAEGGRHEYQYDARRLMIQMRDPRGYVFWWKYDAWGRCTETAGQDGLWWARLEYAPDKRECRVTERKGGVWIYRYDENFTLRERIDPYGGVLRREVDDQGRVRREIDCGGRIMTWLYDGDGAHIGRRDQHGFVFPPEEEFPVLPDPLEPRPPQEPLAQQWKGIVGEFPSASGELSGFLPPMAATAALPLVRFVSSRSPPVSPRHRFDGLGHLLEEVDRMGRHRRWSYDVAGNLVGYRDADERYLELRTTSWNLIGSRTDALGHITSYHYNSTEQPIRAIDPGGTVTEYEYDEKDRLIEIRRHGSVRDVYRYDEGDRLIEKLDGEGNPLLSLKYDKHSHLIERRLASGETHLFAYDDWGRATRASTKAHDVRLHRDPLGRPVQDKRDGRGVEHWYVAGHPIRTRIFDRFLIEYRRDHTTGSVTLIDPTGSEHHIRTCQPGLLLRGHANGTGALLQYDDQGHCEGWIHWKVASDGVISTSTARYRYSAEGDLLEVEDSRHGRVVYETDAAHRLVAEQGPAGRREYRLDAAGNVLAKPGLFNVQLGSGNQLRTANEETFVYSRRNHIAERRRTDGVCVRYVYDSFDQLVRVEDGRGEPWTADYDGIARRIRCGRGKAQTEFFWDGDRLAAEVAPDGRMRLYLYADTEAIVPILFVDYDSLESNPASGRVYTLLTNHQCVPLQVEDATGRTVWWADHIDAYGQLGIHSSSELELNLRWPGHYFDPETGLHYNRFRYYDPILGRYIQSDPLGLAGGLNVYACPANPISRVDILGLHDGRGSAHDGHTGNNAEGKPATNSGVETGHVDSYKEQNRIAQSGDGIDHDHMPAFASIREAVNRQREAQGLDKLSKAEETRLKGNLSSMAIPNPIHKKGRTHSGRGGDARVQRDADDLRRAAQEDMDAHRPNLQAAGHSDEQIDTWESALHARNEQIGLYDSTIPSNLWELDD